MHTLITLLILSGSILAVTDPIAGITIKPDQQLVSCGCKPPVKK